MKKKILLSALSVFGLMIASKTFAQSYNHYTVADHREFRGDDHRDFRGDDHLEFRGGFEAIREDKEKINYDLTLIDQKQEELQRDRAFHNRFAYHQDKRDLYMLREKLANDRNKLEFDMRGAHYGDRDGDRF